MRDSIDIIGTLTFVAVFITIGMMVGASLSQETTSTWWKTQIVSRGYGTWETTIDGRTWFKWKEEVK